MHTGPDGSVGCRRATVSPRRRIDDIDIHMINSEVCGLTASLGHMCRGEHGIQDRSNPGVVYVPQKRGIYRIPRIEHVAQAQSLGQLLPLSPAVVCCTALEQEPFIRNAPIDLIVNRRIQAVALLCRKRVLDSDHLRPPP